MKPLSLPQHTIPGKPVPNSRLDINRLFDALDGASKNPAIGFMTHGPAALARVCERLMGWSVVNRHTETFDFLLCEGMVEESGRADHGAQICALSADGVLWRVRDRTTREAMAAEVVRVVSRNEDHSQTIVVKWFSGREAFKRAGVPPAALAKIIDRCVAAETSRMEAARLQQTTVEAGQLSRGKRL